MSSTSIIQLAIIKPPLTLAGQYGWWPSFAQNAGDFLIISISAASSAPIPRAPLPAPPLVEAMTVGRCACVVADQNSTKCVHQRKRTDCGGALPVFS